MRFLQVAHKGVPSYDEELLRRCYTDDAWVRETSFAMPF
jgi:hypothetical protein